MFSPRIALWCDLPPVRNGGVSLIRSRCAGVGVLEGVFSGEVGGELKGSGASDEAPCLLPGLVGDFSGDRVGLRMALKSRRLLSWNDCILLCAAPLMRDLSGEGFLEGMGFVV